MSSLIPDFNASLATIKSIAEDAKRINKILAEQFGKDARSVEVAALGRFAHDTVTMLESAIEDLITAENGEPTDWDDSASTFCAYAQSQARWFQIEFAKVTYGLPGAYQAYPVTAAHLVNITGKYIEYRADDCEGHNWFFNEPESSLR